MIIFENLPVRLREERTRIGISQEEMADLGGVSKKTQYRNEKNMAALDLNYLKRLQDAGVDVFYVLTGMRAAGSPPATESIPPQLQPVVGSLVNLWLSCTLDDETIDSWAKMFDRWNPFLNPDAKVFPARRVERPLDAPKGDASDLSFLRKRNQE